MHLISFYNTEKKNTLLFAWDKDFAQFHLRDHQQYFSSQWEIMQLDIFAKLPVFKGTELKSYANSKQIWIKTWDDLFVVIFVSKTVVWLFRLLGDMLFSCIKRSLALTLRVFQWK